MTGTDLYKRTHKSVPVIFEHYRYKNDILFFSWHDACVRCRQMNGQYSINPYPTAFPYGNGMVLHFYQQQESSTTKTVHKVINKGLKTYV